jgi:hypothetical protein
VSSSGFQVPGSGGLDLSHCHLAPGVFGHSGFAMPQGKTVEIIALILARPRPPLPPGTDAVEVVKRAAGATSSALSFKCKCALLSLLSHTAWGIHTLD